MPFSNRSVALGALFLVVSYGLPVVALAGQGPRLSKRIVEPSPVSGQDAEDPDSRWLTALYLELSDGGAFALEEGELLRRWASGVELDRLELAVLRSRVLLRAFVQHVELTGDDSKLLEAYQLATARRSTAILDQKMRLLAEREHAAKAAAPREPAAPPPNDTCAGAVVIPGSGPFPAISAVTADITDATSAGDPAAPACQTSVSRSTWYSFTPTTTAVYTISTCADAGTATTVDDTVIGVYTSTGGCSGPFTAVPTTANTNGCDDDSCASEENQAELITELAGGTTYFVVVWLFGSPAPTAGNTAVQLEVSQAPIPSSDVCSGAAPLTLSQPVAGSTLSAANDYVLAPAATCFTGIGQTVSSSVGRDVVYSFTPAVSGAYSFRITNVSTAANAVLYLSTVCPASSPGSPGTVTSCANAANRTPGGTSEESMCASLAAGVPVFVFVDEATMTVGTTFTIEVTVCTLEAEPNGTSGTASTRSCGIEGALSPSADADFYSLGATSAGQRVFATVDGVAGNSSDFDLRVTTSTDTLEYDDADNDAPLGPFAPNVSGTTLTAASAFLRVSHVNPGTQAEPYRVYSVIQPPSALASAESEPNGSTAQANSAGPNYFSGALSGPSPSADVDVFQTPAAAGDLLFIGLDGDPTRANTPLNARLELLDSTGAVLVSANDGNSSSNTTSGAASLTATAPRSPGESIVLRVTVSGTYFVRVSAGSASATTAAGDYLVSIAKNCQTGGGGAGSGPGADGPGLYAPSTGAFFLRNSSSNGPADIVFTYGAAGSGLVPLTGDWNGDGVDTPGLYSPATGAFFLRNANSGGAADLVFTFGAGGAGFVAITGDWDGNGTDTIGLYQPATGAFFLRDTNASGNADIVFTFGAGGQGFVPVDGDWDGNGTDTIGLYLPSSGVFFLRNANAGGPADLAFTFGAGGQGFVPVAGDWDGNGADAIGIYAPSTGAFFLRNTNTNGAADIVFTFGAGNATPLAGDWDGL